MAMAYFKGHCPSCDDRKYIYDSHYCNNCGKAYCDDCYFNLKLYWCTICVKKICCDVCFTISSDCICQYCIDDEDMIRCHYCRGYYLDDAILTEKKCSKCQTTQSCFDLLPNELLEMILIKID